MLIEVFYILFFFFAGEFVSHFLGGFIPGSVIGMILLFLALVAGLGEPLKVKKEYLHFSPRTWVYFSSPPEWV